MLRRWCSGEFESFCKLCRETLLARAQSRGRGADTSDSRSDTFSHGMEMLQIVEFWEASPICDSNCESQISSSRASRFSSGELKSDSKLGSRDLNAQLKLPNPRYRQGPNHATLVSGKRSQNGITNYDLELSAGFFFWGI